MPIPVTADVFTARGASPQEAERLASEHNNLAGNKEAVGGVALEAPTPREAYAATPMLRPAPLSAEAQDQIAQLRADRANGQISDHRWRTEIEPRIMALAGVGESLSRFEAASGNEKSVRIAQMDADATQQAIEKSISENMTPATSPADYTLPRLQKMTVEETEADQLFREAMHSAGIPRELGNHLGEAVSETVTEFQSASNSEAQAAIVQRDTAALQKRWGADFERNVETVRQYLREQGDRSPKLKGMLTDHPELFGSVTSMTYLLQLARHQRRSGKGA